MPDFSERSGEVEIMDDLNCTGDVLFQTLRELEVINKWLGGNRITLDAIENLLERHTHPQAITIADLGCGGGDMLRLIDLWGRKKKIRFNLVGIDANPNIVEFAKQNQKDFPHIQFQSLNIFSEEFRRQKYDIVIGTLFYHHFSREQLVSFFKQLNEQVTIGFIINDIHRHWLAYYSIKLLTQAFSKSTMVQYDAPLSVLRAFKKHELEEILDDAGAGNFDIRWRWAFRWQVIANLRP
jgi:2-polyprenyl-3-methyl-5-hydroxy-6-metoxy-1,4-benzoquinol methylase